MSKKKCKLLKGRFYFIYTTGGQHPSLIFKKNRRKNKYYAVVLGTSGGRHRTQLKHPTSPTIAQSYVQNRPLLGIRKDFGTRELMNIKIHRDDKIIIKIVEHREPKLTNEYKKKHKK